MSTFKDLLDKNCSDITNKVYEVMSANRYKVGAEKIPIPKTPILYRWWFPKSFIENVLKPYTKDYTPLKTLLNEVSKQDIDCTTYYALYFGKSVNGYQRFRQHATGNIHSSTLRRTLYGLLYSHSYDKTKENDITAMLKDCYYEWYPFDEEGELVECIEAICIALGKYPLNIDGNPSIDDKWCQLLMDKRNIKYLFNHCRVRFAN